MNVLKKEKISKEKPIYNLWKNSAYMISLAWKYHKSVLLLCALLAAIAVASNLVQLFITPSILKQVETKASLSQLLLTIGGFIVSLMILKGLDAYISQSILFGRFFIRNKIVNEINHKVAITSFPNTEDPSVLKKLDKASMATSSNHEATEAIWYTLTDLVKNLAGFTIYIILLSTLNLFLIGVILVTSLLGYFINKYFNEWGYRNREEEAKYSR